MRTGWRVLLTMLLNAVAVSCSGADDSGATEPDDRPGSTSSSVPVESLVGEFRLGEPLGYLNGLSRGSEVLFSAVERETQACMEGKGFRYEPMVMSDLGAPGIAEVVMAARQRDPGAVTGYGFSEWNARQPAFQGGDTDASFRGETEDPPPDPNDPNAFVYDLPEAEQDAWNEALTRWSASSEEKETVTYGPDGGATWVPDSCTSIGLEAVYGALDEWYRVRSVVTEQMRNEAYDRLEADPVVQDGIEAWAACMGEGGFEVAALQDPIRQLQVSYPPGTEASASVEAEAAMAPVDARCFQETGLDEVLGDAQRRVEGELLAANEAAVIRYVELYEAALVRARDGG